MPRENLQWPAAAHQKRQGDPDSQAHVTQKKGLANQLAKQQSEEQQKELLLKKIMALVLYKEGRVTFQSVARKIDSYHKALSIDDFQYKALCSSFCMDIQRAMGGWVEVSSSMRSETLRQEQSLALQKIILNCKTALDPQLYRTLITWVLTLFGLKQGQPPLPSSLSDLKVRMYELARRKLRDRQGSTSGFEEGERAIGGVKRRGRAFAKRRPKESRVAVREPLNNTEAINSVCAIWNQEYEQFLIKCYRQTQSFAQISQLFCMRFPEDKELWARVALKSRLRRSIRQRLKHLKTDADKMRFSQSFPLLVKIDERRQAMIFCRAAGRPIRLLLLKQLPRASPTDLKNLVISVNKFIEEEENKQLSHRRSSQDESEEQLRSIKTDKQRGEDSFGVSSDDIEI